MERILIVDDDQDALTVLQMILTKKGYRITTAFQEAQVYEAVARTRPHLILMDVLLSGADGRHICRRLKDSGHEAIPIIMFSAHPGAQKNMEEYGADDFLHKPFQEKDLMEKVTRLLAMDAADKVSE